MNNKDAYYFTHDSNSKDDPKCMMLIEALQLEGYGIFWILVETLRDQPDYKYPLALVPALARRYNTTKDKVNSVIYDYGLFQIEDKKFFYSESLNRRMIAWDQRKEKFRLAGIESGKVRRLKAIEHRSNNVGTSLELIDKNREDKNRIEKNKKEYNKHKYGEYKHVLLTDDEYQKLSDKLDDREKWIQRLDEYIEQTGKSYKNHSLTMVKWYNREAEKKSLQRDTFRVIVNEDPEIKDLIKRSYEEGEK